LLPGAAAEGAQNTSPNALKVVACRNKRLLVWLPTCLRIIYSVAWHFNLGHGAPAPVPLPRNSGRGALHCLCPSYASETALSSFEVGLQRLRVLETRRLRMGTGIHTGSGTEINLEITADGNGDYRLGDGLGREVYSSLQTASRLSSSAERRAEYRTEKWDDCVAC